MKEKMEKEKREDGKRKKGRWKKKKGKMEKETGNSMGKNRRRLSIMIEETEN